MCFRRGRGMALAVILAAFISGSARAEIKPRIRLDRGTVIINGRAAVRFQASNGSLSVERRAQITAGRLVQLVAQNVDPNIIRAQGATHQARVYAGDRMICIATAADARANRTSPLSLASSWASNIKSLLLMPPIVLGTSQLLVPLGENRSLEVRGAAVGPIYAKIGDTEIATVGVGTGRRYVQVMGQQLGETVLEISVEGERASLPVYVKKYAGRVSHLSVAEVTGNPCPASFVSYAAGQAVVQSAVIEPGTRLELGRIESEAGALGRDRTRLLTVPARISGQGYITYAAQAEVEVRNVPMPRDEARELFYSNFPERLSKYQTLFAGRLKFDSSTRILYHHQNLMGKRVHLILEVINAGATPAKLRVASGVSSPRVDTVLVGYIAGNAFLKNHQNNVSVVETIPAQSRLVLVSHFLEHNETASGILQLRQMSGQGAYVRITAAEPWVDNVSRGTIAPAPDPIVLQLSDHIYPSPTKNVETTYVVGERWAFIPIGKHALDDSAAQKKLYGNYGVTYNINVKVDNPTSETKKVSVLFEPSAGLACGVFIIDGKFVWAKHAQPPLEVPLVSYSLKPGEVRNVTIVTVPLAGSNYPANLVVRS